MSGAICHVAGWVMLCNATKQCGWKEGSKLGRLVGICKVVEVKKRQLSACTSYNSRLAVANKYTDTDNNSDTNTDTDSNTNTNTNIGQIKIQLKKQIEYTIRNNRMYNNRSNKDSIIEKAAQRLH